MQKMVMRKNLLLLSLMFPFPASAGVISCGDLIFFPQELIRTINSDTYFTSYRARLERIETILKTVQASPGQFALDARAKAVLEMLATRFQNPRAKVKGEAELESQIQQLASSLLGN